MRIHANITHFYLPPMCFRTISIDGHQHVCISTPPHHRHRFGMLGKECSFIYFLKIILFRVFLFVPRIPLVLYLLIFKFFCSIFLYLYNPVSIVLINMLYVVHNELQSLPERPLSASAATRALSGSIHAISQICRC